MNELSIIFDKIGIDTSEVLEAAGTKWNFLKFKPGLVGGHCIGVDPYYLTHKAEMLGYHPQVILAGRRINDGMGKFIAEQTIKQMIAAAATIKGAKVNVLGLTFKENCGDLRNSKVIDIIHELKSYGVEVLRDRPAGRGRRGDARVRRAAARRGTTCRAPTPSWPRWRTASSRPRRSSDFAQEAGQGRRLHRREGGVRRAATAGGRLPLLAPVTSSRQHVASATAAVQRR